jgi:hypothetical protein
MRFKHQGVWTDGNGRRIDSAVVSAFLAGTETAASVYADSSGGVAINSVTTDESGLYEFWVDDTDYTQDQLFKIIMAKTNFQSKTIDDIEIFKSNRMILKGDKNSFIDGRTDPRVITIGAVRQAHTAGVPGTRAYHIDIRPNGFDDTSGIVIRHDLEGGSNVIRPKCLNLSVDITGATNAHFNAIEVAKVGDIGAGMKVDALDIRQGVGVIDQESGTTEATDTAFKYDDSGASYTDVTTAFGSAGTDVSIFDEDSDYIYIGHASMFTTIEVILSTVASKSVKPIFEYSQGASSWNTINVSDDTNGFRENGNIFFEEPGDWATDTVNAVGSKYWVRIQRNNNNVPVVPIEDTIKIASATNYSWDADGNLIVNDITANDISGAAITSSGVMTAGSLQIDDTTGDHQYIFTVNELSADRNIDLPLLAGNDEMVMKDHPVTMIDKTLGTGTKIALGSDADGDIYYRDSGVLIRLAKGVDGQVLELSSGIPAWTNLLFTQSFTSAEQTLTAAGALVLAHSLSSTPYLMMPYLICKTGELGYSADDEVLINPNSNTNSTTSHAGLSVVPDGTNVNIRYGSFANIFNIIRKDTGNHAPISIANWKLIIRAWA